MFTDVANSTEIANAIGDHLDLQAAIIAEQEGILVKTLGDGSMSGFDSASSALRAAIKTQTASAEVDSDSNLKLRIGIHACVASLQFDGRPTQTTTSPMTTFRSLRVRHCAE